MKMNESDFRVQFPIEAFESPEFKMQLNNFPLYVLPTFGLENNADFPNFEAIKEFLDIRFNMKEDNTEEGNPLADIPRISLMYR